MRDRNVFAPTHASVLQWIFLVLKLTDNINWHWAWILSPLIFGTFMFVAGHDLLAELKIYLHKLKFEKATKR